MCRRPTMSGNGRNDTSRSITDLFARSSQSLTITAPQDLSHDQKVLECINDAISNAFAAKVNKELINASDELKASIKQELNIPANQNEYQIPIWEHLSQASSYLVSKRSVAGRSLDLVLRGASYYVRIRMEVGKGGRSIGALLEWFFKPIVYDELKSMKSLLAHVLRAVQLNELANEIDSWMRSGKNPTSPPGGARWALQGWRDAKDEHGGTLVTQAPFASRIPPEAPPILPTLGH